MFRHWNGIIAIGVFLVVLGFAPASSAQVIDNTNAVDTGKIRIPAEWNEPMKSIPNGDFQRLEISPTVEKHDKIQVGPLEFEGRTLTGEAPWQPHEEPWQPWFPHYQRAHTAFSWSFDLRLHH
jgi:hypothetical protein